MKTPIEMLFDGVEWTAEPPVSDQADAMPYVTHSGILELLDHKLRVYRLSNGMAIIQADDFANLFGFDSPEEMRAELLDLTGKDYPGMEFVQNAGNGE